jgi:hypothetical protein
MSYWIIAGLAAIGIATWLYIKVLRSTGNNTKSSLIVAAISGLLLFFLLWLALAFAAGHIKH